MENCSHIKQKLLDNARRNSNMATPRLPTFEYDPKCQEYHPTREHLPSSLGKLDKAVFNGAATVLKTSSAKNIERLVEDYVQLSHALGSPILPQSNSITDAHEALESVQKRDSNRTERLRQTYSEMHDVATRQNKKVTMESLFKQLGSELQDS